MRTRPVMVRLDDADHARLEAEALELGMAASTLAEVLLHATLTLPSTGVGRTGTARLAALDRLGELRANLPSVDAVDLLRAGRRELERRHRVG